MSLLWNIGLIFHLLATSMWSNSSLESGSVNAYLCIHVPHDDFDIMVWGLVDQVLQLLVEIFIICILMVICRCITLGDRDFGMMSHKSHLYQSLSHWLHKYILDCFVRDVGNTFSVDVILSSKKQDSLVITDFLTNRTKILL